MVLTTPLRGRRLGLTRGRECQAAPQLRLDQVDAPHGLDDLVDPGASHASVDLDDPRAAARALPLDVQHTGAEPERLDCPNAEIDEPANGLAVVSRRAVQTGLLERGLGRRPVLRDAREQAPPVVHDQVDVELDAVQVLLQQQIVAGPEDHVVLGGHDAPHQRIHPRKRLHVVHSDAADGAGTELGFHDRREADVRGCREQLVERPHALGARRRQPQLGRELTCADLAARRVHRLGRIARQSQGGGDSRNHADAVLPEREHAVRPDPADARAASTAWASCSASPTTGAPSQPAATPSSTRDRDQ